MDLGLDGTVSSHASDDVFRSDGQTRALIGHLLAPTSKME